MTFFLELKEKFFKTIGKREKLALAAVKFVIALVAYLLINYFVGYNEFVGNPLLLIALAALSAFPPVSFTLFVAVVLILVNFYTLALELCIIGLLLFVLMFCLYFRFTKDKGFYALLTPIFCFLRIPYVMPNAVGISSKPYDVISVLCGTMVYFLLKNVRTNEALFRSFEESEVGTSRLTLALNQLFVNKEMFLYMSAFVIAAIAVYFIRKSSNDHAWGTSIIVGSVIQCILVGVGMIAFGSPMKALIVLAGSFAALLLSAGLMFIIRPLDYSRVERVEFEDEEYYYYVKAVPKLSMELEEREVKQIATKRRKAVKPPGRGKKSGQVQLHSDIAQDIRKELTKEEKVAAPPSKEDELARMAMKEFDIEGDWLE